MRAAHVLVLLMACYVNGYDNGMGATPPMGWNTWCTDDLCGLLDICTEKEVLSVANALVDEGMYDLGYTFINLDDCWSDTERDSEGRLQPNPKQFPNGMKYVADTLHSLGLHLGLYTCVGTETCHGGRPGSYGNWQIDAETLAGWGVDFVKSDYCHRPDGSTAQQLYGNFSAALNATGRPILFSLCEWGEDQVYQWGGTVGQMFRIQMDHLPFYSFPPTGAGAGFGQGTKQIIEYMATLQPSKWVKPYSWMDPDFLETLFPITMSFIDSRTEYAFWTLWSAPLLVSTDIRNMTADMKAIIMNPEVIAIDQDPAFIGGDRIANYSDGGQVWTKPLANGDTALILFNPGFEHINVAVTWAQVGWSPEATVSLRDLWARNDLGEFADGYNVTLVPHDHVYLRATVQSLL